MTDNVGEDWGEGKPLISAVDARSFLRHNGHGLRPPSGRRRRGRAQPFRRKGVLVVLPPRPPIPSPARFILEDSALRERRRFPCFRRPPEKILPLPPDFLPLPRPSHFIFFKVETLYLPCLLPPALSLLVDPLPPRKFPRCTRSPSPARRSSATSLPDEASPSAPALLQRVAGAKAIPDARRADGAPKQARTSPGRNGREGSRRCPARHAADGVQSNSRDYFRVTAQRGVRGCRGCRGDFSPLTPCPAPGRRPAAHAGRQPQDKEEPNQRQSRTAPLTPCPAPGRRPAACMADKTCY